MDAWYYLMHDIKIGPVTKDDLEKLAAKGVISSETLVWTQGHEEWKCFGEFNRGRVLNHHPPMPPPVPVNPNPDAKSNSAFSLLGKAVVAVFIFCFLCAIIGDRENSSSTIGPDNVIAEATRSALIEFGSMNQAVKNLKFSNEIEFYDFVISRLNEIQKIPNIDSDLSEYLQRYIQSFATHKSLVQRGAAEVMNAAGNNLQRDAIIQKFGTDVKASDANLLMLVKEIDLVVSRIKRRYPTTDFNNL